MNHKKPKIKIKDLGNNPRKFMRAIIRTFCLKNGLYEKGHKNGFGLEVVEESVEELINLGELIVYYNPDEEMFSIQTKEQS